MRTGEDGAGLPRPEDVIAALELGACPWCGDPAVTSPSGPRCRCRGCGARWVVTPYGGIAPEPAWRSG